MTTIKIKSAIQETDISKRLRQFQEDLLRLKLIKKGQDPVQELEGDSGNYIITVELDKTPKELLPLLESLGVPYEGTKYFDDNSNDIQYTLVATKKGSKNARGYYFPSSIRDDESKFKKLKSLIDYVFPSEEYNVNLLDEEDWNNLSSTHYAVRESYKELTEQNKDKLKYHFERYFSDLKDSGTEIELFASQSDKQRIKSYIDQYGESGPGGSTSGNLDPKEISEALDIPEETVKEVLGLFSNPTDVTIRYCTPDGNVGTVVVPSIEAHQKMKDLASNGCTKVRITNDDHYTRDNGPRSEVKEESEFEELFSALRTRLENAPKDIKKHFNNLINYFSNK